MRSKLLNKIGGGKEINLDDLVFTSKELMDIFSKHNNPIVREQFNGKFIKDTT